MDVLLITNSVRSLNDKEFCNLLLKIPVIFVQISQKIRKMTIRSDTKQLAMILFNLLYAMKDDLEVKGQGLPFVSKKFCLATYRKGFKCFAMHSRNY